MDAELLLERLETSCAPTSAHERFVQTSTSVPSDGLEVEHVVEGRDRLAVRGREVERVGDLAEASGESQPSRSCASRSAGSTAELAVGVLGRDLLHLRVELGVAHRSTSPMTASSEPTIAIRSATSASRMQVAVASSATKDGARKCTRHGLAPPSETR